MHTTEKIWHEYQQKLLAFIRTKVNENDIAEDILQEVFIKIHSQISSLEEETKLRSWIYQITRNTIIDHYRTKKTQYDLPEWLEQPEPDDEAIIRQELSLCLTPMIKRLPKKYRLAIQLSEDESKTFISFIRLKPPSFRRSALATKLSGCFYAR